jgi:hypothetical protein
LLPDAVHLIHCRLPIADWEGEFQFINYTGERAILNRRRRLFNGSDGQE